MSKVLITGGLGYIGSHTVVELMNQGHEVVIVDDLSNSSVGALSAITSITGSSPTFMQLDVGDLSALTSVFTEHSIEAVIHFAGFKAVGESVEKPLLYYRNNLESTLSLLTAMREHGVTKLIFSSSATVYQPLDTQRLITEEDALGAPNPYGRTKLFIEEILRDLTASDPDWQISLLRYFNPIGAHPSGAIGENPSTAPNNLLPYVSRVAAGELNQVSVFGNDYDTVDGTGVRDYLHVVDLARGHLASLDNLKPGIEAYNLGTGHGTSVLELIMAFEEASGKSVPYTVTDRRPGDLAYVVADPTKANRQLNWKAELSIVQACRDEWNWISNQGQSTNKT